MASREEIVEEDVPEEYVEEVKKRKQELLEAVSNADDAIGEMFIGKSLKNSSFYHIAWKITIRLHS